MEAWAASRRTLLDSCQQVVNHDITIDISRHRRQHKRVGRSVDDPDAVCGIVFDEGRETVRLNLREPTHFALIGGT